MGINIRPIAHLETLPVLAQLFKLKPQDWQPVKARGEGRGEFYGLGASLLLRSHDPVTKENWLDDLPINETKELKGWFSMKKLLRAATQAIMAEPIAKQYLDGEMGRAMISRLDPGSTIFWHIDDGPYHAKHVRFHLPLVTNPGCNLYSGAESLHVPQGTLTFFNNKIRHCAANFGNAMRLHLVFEMCRIETDDDKR